ncbi:MAG: penicillin-binding transpeptidase domain-containing protein [Solirubrobacteraceae bacterium]
MAFLAAVVFVAVEALGGGAPAGAVLAESYARDWTLRDWAPLYADLDARSRAALPFERFVALERDDVGLATATGASVGSASSAAGGRFVVGVSVRTRIFGTLDERFVLTMTGPTGSPRVRWDDAARFPGLTGGERLRRIDTAPPRGVLLARDGTPLRSVPAASNLIGSVGPAAGALLEQTIAAGFPASTPVGLDGLELVFQRQLGGTPGGLLYAGGRLLASAVARAGANVRTSISPSLQALAVAELGTSTGGIVVMAPSTGELLAAAGAPLSELQPPGSTFKIITLTGVLEAHLATPSTVFPYATSVKLDGFTLHDSNGEDCGGTLANSFAVSCNSVFAPLGARLGAADLVHAATVYGFNSPSTIPIAAESTIPAGDLTDAFELGESAIGQAQVLASPLQMARVAATIALVGRRPVPTFSLVRPRRFPRVIPVSVARKIRELMHEVVSNGTGVLAQIPGVVVAGKTGTAEVDVPAACGPTGASGATGTTGTGGTSGTNDPVAGAASAAPVARAAATGTGGSSAPGTGGSVAPTGGASGASGSTGAGGAGTGGAGAPTGTGPSSAAGSTSGTGGAGGTTSATSPTGPSSSTSATGTTGATGCPTAGLDNNPYDTDAWFVAFAPEIHPRYVVSVLLPHDGAGGTTAAPLAKAILEQALATGA